MRAGLEPAVTDATITGVEVFEARTLRRHDNASGDFAAMLTGRVMRAPARRG